MGILMQILTMFFIVKDKPTFLNIEIAYLSIVNNRKLFKIDSFMLNI